VGTFCAGKVLAAHQLAAPQGTIAHDWHGIWMIPAVGAMIVLAVFMIFFRNPVKKPKPAPEEAAVAV
jgi:hypothetical protein